MMIEPIIRIADSPSYWTKRALNKLKELHFMGADFGSTRWFFDWSENLTTTENLISCDLEQKALLALASTGTCKVMSIPIDFKDITPALEADEAKNNRPAFIERNRLTDQGAYREPKEDLARWHYPYAVYITSFDYQKFLQQCKLYGVSPTSHTYDPEEVIKLIFMFPSIPTVVYNGVKYQFHSMVQDGRLFKMITYCLGKQPTSAGIEDLIKIKGLSGVTNIKDEFKNSIFSHKDGLLRDFAEISSDTLIMKTVIRVSSTKLQALLSKSINRISE